MMNLGGAIGPGPGALGTISTSAETRSGRRSASWIAEGVPAEWDMGSPRDTEMIEQAHVSISLAGRRGTGRQRRT